MLCQKYNFQIQPMKPKKKRVSEEAAPVTDTTQQLRLVLIHFVRLLSSELWCCGSHVAAVAAVWQPCGSCVAASWHLPSGWPSASSSLSKRVVVRQQIIQLCSRRCSQSSSFSFLIFFFFKLYKSVVGWRAALLYSWEGKKTPIWKFRPAEMSWVYLTVQNSNIF